MSIKIAIGVPSGDMVHADFAMSLARLMSYTMLSKDKIDIILINVKSSIVQKGRHETVLKALKFKVDYLLFLDSDMVFPADVIIRLLDSGMDVIGCNYPTRNTPFKPTCRNKLEQLVNSSDDSITEVGFIATGCLLINMKVFKKMKAPYFNVEWRGKDFLGEDYLFCEAARKLGYSVFCDNKLSKEIKHIGCAGYKL
jgi:hypothetical protein